MKLYLILKRLVFLFQCRDLVLELLDLDLQVLDDLGVLGNVVIHRNNVLPQTNLDQTKNGKFNFTYLISKFG